ncbi:MAG: circadian clock KaiB family protein [Methanoregulaceae archaeon]|nr:circadian clock KaiB family protein [Methanoregulaceae archaeon]
MPGPKKGTPVTDDYPSPKGREGDCIDLRLYVTNETPNCLAAFANIKRICEDRFEGRYRITVIDLVKNPRLAREENILAIPTLVRVLRGEKGQKVIGTLSNVTEVLTGLGLSYEGNGAPRKIKSKDRIRQAMR